MNGLKYVMTSCITSIHGNSMQILKKLSERFDQMIRDYAYSWFKKKFKDRNDTRSIRPGIELLSSDLIKKSRILSTNATIHTFLPTVVATSLWLTKLVLGLKSNSRIGLFFNETNHASIIASRFLIDEAGNFIEYDLVLEKIKRDAEINLEIPFYGYEIKEGKIGKPVRGTIKGKADDFLRDVVGLTSG